MNSVKAIAISGVLEHVLCPFYRNSPLNSHSLPGIHGQWTELCINTAAAQCRPVKYHVLVPEKEL